MRSSKSWNQVVAQIERSGLAQEKELMLLNHQRQSQVQLEILDQINIAITRRNEQQRQKKNERKAVEASFQLLTQKERKNKQQYKQKEQKMRIQNFRMLNERNEAQHRNSSGFNQPVYKQNPITESLYGRSEIREKKQRDYRKQFDQINHEIAQSRLRSQSEIRKLNKREQLSYRNQIEQKFKKIDQQRYKFQKECLEGRHKNQQRLVTEPDSLQKQYSLYLDKQIADRKNRQDYSIFRSPKDDKIFDQHLLKINHNPEVQSSSPAYLGRIPYNSDRQRQLQYLNRQLTRHRRLKTEANLQQPEYKKPPSQQPVQRAESKKILLPAISVLPTPEMKSAQQKAGKTYKSYNIITGNYMVKTEGHS